MKTRTYAQESMEWEQIKDEMLDSGVPLVTAFDISQEQWRRMSTRGERPLTYKEIMASEELARRSQLPPTEPCAVEPGAAEVLSAEVLAVVPRCGEPTATER